MGGTRNVNRGNVALQALMREDARVARNIALVQVDVADPDSIVAASESVKEKLGNEQLYALVNNAGCIIKDDVTKESMVEANVYGVKRMSEAFIPLINPSMGRIVNLGGGFGGVYVAKLRDKGHKALLSS